MAQQVLLPALMFGSPNLSRDQLYGSIVQALIDARLAAKLRQVDVADRVGWPQVYVSRYENHERTLNVAEYVEVARAVGADLVVLLARVLDRENQGETAVSDRPPI